MSLTMTDPRPSWDAATAAADAQLDAPVTAADLEQDPRTEPEALCLCSLLWSSRTDAAAVVEALQADDFAEPIYRELFEILADQIRTGVPHDPVSINAALLETGRGGGHRGELLRRTLTATSTLGTDGTAARHYASLVLTAAYRRSFHTAGTAVTQAAEQLHQDDLFDHLVAIGVEQRKATNRLRDTLHHLR